MGEDVYRKTDDKIRLFTAKFKETYKCLNCGKKVKFWPFVVNNQCPFCGKPILRQLMEVRKLSLECQTCGAPITSIDPYMTDYCKKCHGSPGGIPFKSEAYDEAKKLSPYRLYWVKCDRCGRKMETRDLLYEGVFPLAGFCRKCNKIICWNCGSMHFASGVWEANEFAALARAGNLIALHIADGSTMAPRCPNCQVYLEPIVNLHAHPTFHLIKTRNVNPLE